MPKKKKKTLSRWMQTKRRAKRSPSKRSPSKWSPSKRSPSSSHYSLSPSPLSSHYSLSPSVRQTPSPVPFHGFLESPSTVSSTSSPMVQVDPRDTLLHPVSPASHTFKGKTLADYQNVILDLCSMTVTLIPPGPQKPPRSYLSDFSALLQREGIRHFPVSHVLKDSTLQIASPHHMRRLACKLSGRVQTVVHG